jgi:hypothetical protein
MTWNQKSRERQGRFVLMQTRYRMAAFEIDRSGDRASLERKAARYTALSEKGERMGLVVYQYYVTEDHQTE